MSKFNSLQIILAIALVSLPLTAHGESLNQKKIHAEYNEGNFEDVILILEGFMRRNRSYSLSDSLFLAKHLAVVYSADPATREKGKYYMFRLLELMPTAKLIDMYISDEIKRIFEYTREEFLSRRGSKADDYIQSSASGTGTDSSDSMAAVGFSGRNGAEGSSGSGANAGKEKEPPAPKIKSAKKSKTFYWVALAAGAAAAGATAFVLLSTDDAPETVHTIP